MARAPSRDEGWDSRPGWVLVGGAVLLAIGSVLPWASATSLGDDVTVNGTESDGVLTILMAALVAGLGFPLVRRATGAGRLVPALVVALLALALCVADMVDIERIANETSGLVAGTTIEYGLYVATLGAAASAVGAVLGLRASHRARGAAPVA